MIRKDQIWKRLHVESLQTFCGHKFCNLSWIEPQVEKLCIYIYWAWYKLHTKKLVQRILSLFFGQITTCTLLTLSNFRIYISCLEECIFLIVTFPAFFYFWKNISENLGK